MSRSDAQKLNATVERAISRIIAQSIEQLEVGMQYLFLSTDHGEDSKIAKEFVRKHPEAAESREIARRVLREAFEDLRKKKRQA